MALIGWIACGILAYGLLLYAFTAEFPWDQNIGIAILGLIGGPLGLFGGLFVSVLVGHFGVRLVPLTYEERWAHFHRRRPTLSRYDFDHNGNDPIEGMK